MIKASEHDYLSTISELQINSQYAAAFMGERLQLHMVRKTPFEFFSEEKLFDSRLKNPKSTSEEASFHHVSISG